MQHLLDIFLHLNEHLSQWAQDYGPWIYAILFAVVFCETGLVVTPFLPGDSLLFAVGMLSGTGVLRIEVAAPLLLVAAICGNTSNYSIGKLTGPKIFRGESGTLLSRLLSRKHLATAHTFFEKHGGKAVMLGQFMPIIRTFVPYVAGAGAMNYSRFIFFNVAGALAWVGICCGSGYFLGGLDFFKKHLEMVIVGIIVVSLIPVFVSFVKSRNAPRGAEGAAR